MAIVVALAACSTEGRPLEDWTLEVDGREFAVSLPSKFAGELPFADTRYRLRARVILENGERGGPLTLVFECFHGDLALTVDGITVPAQGDTDAGEHRFVIPASHTGSSLSLEVATMHRIMSSLGFQVVPRLVTGSHPERGNVAAFNRYLAVLELGLVIGFCVLYAALFAFARRSDDVAFIVIAVCSTAGPLWQLGLLDDAFGPFEATLIAICMCGANVGVLYFLHLGFELGPPPRWLVRLFIFAGLASLLGPLSFALAALSMIGVAIVTLIFAVYLVRRLSLIAKGETTDRLRRSDARLLMIVCCVTGLGMLPDMIGMGIGHSFYGGIHVIAIGIVAFIMTQAVILARHHVARQQALERTAEELRRQVAERSRELAEALAQLAARGPDILVADRTIADRYRVVRKIGAGGMGAVYEVERISDRERLALKTLRGRADPDLMARFAREAQIAAQIDHANLVPVLDVGISEGALYLVMPLIGGGSLEHQRAKFGTVAWAKPLLAQIAAGLDTLHARGIVHRDLKPGNVLLANGVARIADFGLSALRAPTADTIASFDAHGDTAAPLTRAGDLFGTPGYMAPELAAGVHDVQPAVDMFAFGVLAFEMLTGKPAFASPPVLAKLSGHELPAPEVERVPDSLRAIVRRCLDTDPENRPSASALVTALR